MFSKNFCKIRSYIRRMFTRTKNGSLLEILYLIWDLFFFLKKDFLKQLLF